MKTKPQILTWKDNKTYIGADLSWIFSSRYGFPVELYVEMVNEKLKADPTLRRKLIILAYDRAKGTKFINYPDTLVEKIINNYGTVYSRKKERI